MSDKRFRIAVSNDNTVRLIDHKSSNNLISIGFKEHNDAIDCSNALQYLCSMMNGLADENEHYKSIFLELVETALTDKFCRELYCKGILDLFNKANSLNQAREMIKEHLE